MNIAHLLTEHLSGPYKRRPTTSLIKLWLGADIDINQSMAIQFGNKYEEALNAILENTTNVEAISTSEAKIYITNSGEITRKARGNKDVDILFKIGNTVYYRECKCNLQLDSEKARETARKVERIAGLLEGTYPGCHINAAIVNMEWTGNRSDMRGVKIEYMNEFFDRLGASMTEGEYESLGKEIGRRISDATSS